MNEPLITELKEILEQNNFIEKYPRKLLMKALVEFEHNHVSRITFCEWMLDGIELIKPQMGFCFDEVGPTSSEEIIAVLIKHIPTEFFKAKMAKFLSAGEKMLLNASIGFGLFFKSMIEKSQLNAKTNDLVKPLTQIAQEYYQKTEKGPLVFQGLPLLTEEFPLVDFNIPNNDIYGYLVKRENCSHVASILKNYDDQLRKFEKAEAVRSLGKHYVGIKMKRWASESYKLAKEDPELQEELKKFIFKIDLIILIEKFRSSCSAGLIEVLKASLINTPDLAGGFEQVCRFLPQNPDEKELLSQIDKMCVSYFNIFGLPRASSLDVVVAESSTKENGGHNPGFFAEAAAPKTRINHFYAVPHVRARVVVYKK